MDQLTLVAIAKRKADDSVDYSPRYGARCPECGARMRVHTSKPWEENIKVRYHKCTNKSCLIYAMDTNIKSVQEIPLDKQGKI